MSGQVGWKKLGVAPGNGAPGDVPAGTLRLVRGRPNPRGSAGTELFLFAGDATTAPIREIVPAPGVALPPPPDRGGPPFRLVVLHLNDLHGHLVRPTPWGEQAVLSRVAWRVRELRRRCHSDPHQAVLFLSGGDDLAGTALSGLLGHDPASYQFHAAYRALSAAGLDAAVVGNHDLAAGPSLLAHAIEHDACFPLLAANLRAAPPLNLLVHPAALLLVKGRRVGLVGLTTPAELNGLCHDDLEVSHPLPAMRNLLPALAPLCDLLIVVSHLGRCLASGTAVIRDAGDVELAASLPPGSVHLIAGGHSHDVLNETGLSAANLVNGIPIVQAGAAGRFLGEVTLSAGPPAVLAGARLTPVADLPVDDQFEREEVQPLLSRARPFLAQRLGLAAACPPPGPGGGFAAGELALANLVTDALLSAGRAAGHTLDLAAIDASCLAGLAGLARLPRGDLPPDGELTLGDWLSLMPYADTLRVYCLTGRQLAWLLDDNAGRIDYPGEPHVERGFLQFSGEVRYTIERGATRGAARAAGVTVGGLPLARQLERIFFLASTSFVRQADASLAAHGQPEPPLPEALGSICTHTRLVVRHVVLDQLAAQAGAGARLDGRLRVVAGPDKTIA